jgi:class 3 adenylate cyclase
MGPAELTLGDASLITATFLFTDIEGSTNLWETESQAMRIALQRHNALLSAAVERHHGYVFKTVGDAFCVTFDDASEALHAACQIQASLAAARWPTKSPLRVRVALHTGPAYLSSGDYFGTTVNRCARVLAVTLGGQTLLTSPTEALVRESLPADTSLRDTGMLRLRDLPHPMHVFQLIHPGLSPSLCELGGSAGGHKLTTEPMARFRPVDLYEVPTLPAIVVQAVKILQNPNSDARAVERVIVNDPAISAKILRVANSAFLRLLAADQHHFRSGAGARFHQCSGNDLLGRRLRRLSHRALEPDRVLEAFDRHRHRRTLPFPARRVLGR